MRFSPSLFRVAAACSLLSALTTLGLIFLPEWYAAGEGFEGRMARVHDPAYQLRAWIYLVHPFLVLTAALAVALRVRAMAPASALFGALGFVLWAFTEALQQTWTLFAFDAWRRAYLAGDAALRAQMPVQAAVYDGLWNALYVLLLIGFAVGNLLLGAALLRQQRLTRVVGIFLLAAFALTLSNLSAEVEGPTLPASLGPWVYAALQPLGRVLIGVWLWRAAREADALP